MTVAVALLEDLTLSAWPALKTLHHDGWVLRFGGGQTGRANSVNAVRPGDRPLAELVDLADAAYPAQGLDPLFRITPLCPPALVGELDRRGYVLENSSIVQVLDDLADTVADPAVRMTHAASEDWIDAYARIAALAPPRRAALAGILAAIAPMTLYARVEVDGRIAAVALGVVDRGHVGIYDVATAPDHRGRGLARRTVATILAAARDRGAHAAYLQVADINAPALALYGRLGFREVYRYHYRRGRR